MREAPLLRFQFRRPLKADNEQGLSGVAIDNTDSVERNPAKPLYWRWIP
jgi:hypothetical protein